MVYQTLTWYYQWTYEQVADMSPYQHFCALSGIPNAVDYFTGTVKVKTEEDLRKLQAQIRNKK